MKNQNSGVFNGILFVAIFACGTASCEESKATDVVSISDEQKEMAADYLLREEAQLLQAIKNAITRKVQIETIIEHVKVWPWHYGPRDAQPPDRKNGFRFLDVKIESEGVDKIDVLGIPSCVLWILPTSHMSRDADRVVGILWHNENPQMFTGKIRDFSDK